MNKKTYQTLLIEDDELDVKSFLHACKKIKQPNEITVCYTAEEAFEILLTKTFDCIFLDYELPGENGYKLLKRIRKSNITTPLVAISSQGDEQLATMMLTNGAFDYFAKEELSPERIFKSLLSAIKIKNYNKKNRQLQEKLQDKTIKLNAILESNQNLIFSIDNNYRITSYNSAFKNAVEHITQKHDSIKKDISFANLVLDFNIKNHWLDNIKQALEGSVISVAEKISFSKKRNDTWYESNFNPIRGYNNEVTGVAIFTVDITDKKQAENEIHISKNKALHAAKAKSEFLSNMSHEIRTPMNAILGLSECLLKEEMSANARDFVNSIKYSAENLLNIINDILDLSKIESGKIKLEKIDFDIYQCLYEIKATFQHKTESKGLYLHLNIAKDVPKIINGDPYRLNQILYNLIGNAIKFTEVGGIDINVHLFEKTNDAYSISFEVKDTGIGIPKSKQNEIFESFTQAGPDTSRKFGGTGLGLTITKNLIELQHGTIDLISEPKKGSSFLVKLSFSKRKPISKAKEDIIDLVNIDLSNYKFLLVEDNKMNQFVTTQIFKHWKNEIQIVNNGKEAISHLTKKNDYDLILMDLQMPEMDGFETCRFIRNQPEIIKNNKIPILALTADAFDDTKTNALNAGMNDFVTKPYKVEILLSKIFKHLNLL